MKLDFPKNMGRLAGVRCRQAPLRGLIGALVVCACFIGFAVLVWQQGFPWFAWGGFAAVAALIAPLMIADALAKFRSTNWLVWLCPDELWINLRSYRNHHLPEAATVLFLPYKEIRRAHRHIETWSTPADQSSLTVTQWKEESLELHLVSGDARKIAEALADERGRRAAIKGPSQAVTVPTPGVIRIAWRGHGNDVVPPLDRVLDELRQRIEVSEPTRTDRANCYQLGDDELDELIAQLIRSGDNTEAIELLVRRRGCSTTEAHKLVKEQATQI
jgi:hypothetical protein